MPSENSKPLPHLNRGFGLLQSTALNMSNMIGIGPFITMPLLITAMGGPQAMLGWVVAVLIAIPDGMVWSELGASMPGDGGSYLYLREGFGPQSFGRLMAFLFIWQFVLSGPLEIASGYIGFSDYLQYIWVGMTHHQALAVCVVIGIINIVLLYRRIDSIAKITVSLWIGILICVGAVILTGALHFNPKLAFDFPRGAFAFSTGFLFGLGAATRLGVYDYMGYYDVCYIAGEVRNPGRVIPRSIVISLIAVAFIYFAMNLSVIGVVPWRDFVPAADKLPDSNFIFSIFMEKVYGSGVASIFTALVLWTAFASVFALLLGNSRIPFAAAQDGYFFKVFGRLHPKKGFPHVSLLAMGALSIVASFFSLDTVIAALIAMRIIIQFAGQVVAVFLLRKRQPNMSRPYRIWLYPLPNLMALVGWIFIFATTEVRVLLFGTATLLAGFLFFLVWSWRGKRWPFAEPQPLSANPDV
ncbi:MAG TPA: APC family permease [Blastocatellia bacterium]|nr:APC family permease [Blastocatellia bacterium]